jgi:hypothetical protein
MEKYRVLLNINKSKKDLLFEFTRLFSTLNIFDLKEKVELITSSDKHGHEIMGVTETQFALINKVEHILFYRGGLKDVIDMLDSFKKGVKNLKTAQNNHDHEKQYSYKEANGITKLSHNKNLKKAHFRWNDGKRYTLSNKDIRTINTFTTHFLTSL